MIGGLAAFVGSSVGLSSYAFAIEPLYRLVVTRYRVRPAGWPSGLKLRLALIADLHACEPWVGRHRIQEIVRVTNSLDADAILLLGDYVAGHRFVMGRLDAAVWAPLLGKLDAPLGVHAILGNHDWWDDPVAQRRGQGPTIAGRELEKAGIKVYENAAVRLRKNGVPFWLAGLGDQLALRPPRYGSRPRVKALGVDDLPGTLAKVTDDAPVVLMAHEPDIFPVVPERVALTVSGHTHGGQFRVFGYSPVVPSEYGNRYAYGHIVEDARHLIVSGGLGCSIAPVRFGVPPEIVLVEIGQEPMA